MASKAIAAASSRVGQVNLDLPMAALAAVAAAVAAYAIPGDLLAGIVSASGLPALLPAAEPPLGTTARLALGGVGAAAVFAIVFMLLRLIDRLPARGVELDEEEQEVSVPRLRRRDFHPDAPARRPLFAELDLGEPQEFTLDVGAAEPRQEPEQEWQPVPASEPESARKSEAMWEPELILEPEAERPSESEPEVEATTAAELMREPQPFATFTPSPTVEPEPVIAPAASVGSLAELVGRLERGLERRAAPAAPHSVEARAPAPAAEQAPSDPLDARLRSAIDSLQRIASRN